MTARWSDQAWAHNPQHWLVVRAKQGETDAHAALVILSQPQFAARVASFIGDGQDAGSIHFQRMLEAAWSSGERALLELAAHLWNSGQVSVIDLDYLLRALSDEWLAVALAAMAARHGAPLPIGGQS